MYDNVPYSVTSIGEYAFRGCTRLTSVTIGDSVTSIGKYAFDGCTGLTFLTIPGSVTSIGDYAFDGCSSLKELTLADGAETLSLAGGDFSDCPLEKLYLGRNLSYTTSYYSPFKEQKVLFSVVISNSVTSIGENAFQDCTGLTSLTIGDSVRSIRRSAFYNCTRLTSVTFPGSVKSIDESAFYGTTLKEVCLPSKVTVIGDSAFAKCQSIEKVVSLNPIPPEIESSTFGFGVKVSATLHVPEGSRVYYLLDPVWKEFANIVDDVVVESGLDGVVAAEEDITVYNLKDACVYAGAVPEARLDKGIYIVRQGSKTYKICVK